VCAFIVLLLAGLGLIAAACAGGPNEAATTTTLAAAPAPPTTLAAAPAPTTTTAPAMTPPPRQVVAVLATTTTTASRQVTVAIAGDVLTNAQVLNSLARTGPDAYDFGPIFAPVAPYLRAADYTVVNLETRLAGADRGYSTFPRFNTPDSLATALKGAGVDMVANANNHVLDMGWEGLARSIDVVAAAGLDSIGTYRSQAERDAPHIVDVGGVHICFLSYTTTTNGLPVPKDHPYAVNLLDPARVAADSERAREAGADLVIAIIHWGVEYARRPAQAIRDLGEKLVRDCGVDAVVAGHPHVVQPIERVEVPGGPTGGRYIVYSLGNFMSGMSTRYSDGGIVVYLRIEKRDGAAWVSGIDYLPVYMQRGVSGGRVGYRVLPDPPGGTPESDLPITDRDLAKLEEIGWDTFELLDDPAKGVTALHALF
jgi:poly-gamma-glutamate capsule biosynthesis protein CapA/YwtB (metallophosphatase superfamily)